jgi:hypothetical protein
VEAHRGLRSAVLGVLLGGDLPAEVAHRPLRFFGFAPADRLVVVLVQPTDQHVEQCLEDLNGRPYLLAGRRTGSSWWCAPRTKRPWSRRSVRPM